MKHPIHIIHTRSPIPNSASIPHIARIHRPLRGVLRGTFLRGAIGSILVASACLGGFQGILLAQAEEQTVTTTETTNSEGTNSENTNSEGTISEFEPDSIVIRTERSTEPLRYSYTKSTTFVDQNGVPVSMSVVKSGLPVTVYYAREGDRLVASKVIVRRTTETTEPERVIEKKTTTTTTDK